MGADKKYIWEQYYYIYIICSKELYMSHKKEARVTVSEEKMGGAKWLSGQVWGAALSLEVHSTMASFGGSRGVKFL